MKSIGHWQGTTILYVKRNQRTQTWWLTTVDGREIDTRYATLPEPGGYRKCHMLSLLATQGKEPTP